MAYGIYDQDPNVVSSSYYSKGMALSMRFAQLKVGQVLRFVISTNPMRVLL